jgi:hypothetical protein
MSRDVRRHRRIPYVGVVRLTWEDAQGQPRYAQGQCIDVSEGGLRIEVRTPVVAHTHLMLNAEKIKLSGSAKVKHVERYGSSYILGLELSESLREKTLAAIREPWALRAAASPIV